MHRIRSGYLFVMLLLFSMEAQAQMARVTGTVQDSRTGQALTGAHVRLQGSGLQRGTTTNREGRFVFSGLMPGTYVLTVSFLGYTPYRDTLTVTWGARVDQVIALEPAVVTTQEVRVTDSLRQRLAIPTEWRIRPEQLRHLPSLDGSPDLATYLALQPGVMMTGGRGGQVFIRGGTPVQNLVLVDGIPVYQPFHLVGPYSMVPADMLLEAEVFAGGFPARYGGRLSSVIDVSLQHGNKQIYEGGFTLSPVLSGLFAEGPVLRGISSFALSIRQSLLEQSAPWLARQPLPYRFGDALFRFHTYLNATSSFQATGLYAYDQASLGSEGDFPERLSLENGGVGLTYWYLPAQYPAFFSTQVSLAFHRGRLGAETGPDMRTRVGVFSGTMTYGYLLGDWRVQFALFAVGRAFTYRTGERSGEEFLNEGGFYVEGRLPFHRRFTLEPGVRIHGFPARGQLTVAPRLRAYWQPAAHHRLTLAWGIYHQPVVAAYDARDMAQTFVQWIPSPEYQPVPMAFHYLAGWEVTPARGWRLGLEAYVKRLRHMHLVTGDIGVFADRGMSAGMDLKVERRSTRSYAYVAYSLSRTVYETTEGPLAPPHDRRHLVHVLLQRQWGNGYLTVHWQWGSGLPFTPVQGFYDVLQLHTRTPGVLLQEGETHLLYGARYSRRLPPYHRLDASLGYRFAWHPVEVHMVLSLTNIYNQKNIYYFNVWENRRVYHLPLLPSVSMQVRY